VLSQRNALSPKVLGRASARQKGLGLPAMARRTEVRPTPNADKANCKHCRYSHLCNPMPGLCILAFYVAVAVVTIGMAYLFVAEELL